MTTGEVKVEPELVCGAGEEDEVLEAEEAETEDTEDDDSEEAEVEALSVVERSAHNFASFALTVKIVRSFPQKEI